MSNTIFKVGDTVYDEVNFPGLVGVVDRFTKSEIYPVLVKFKGEKLFGAYTVTGRSHMLAERPTLSHTPYEVVYKGFSQRKDRTFKPFDRVLVSDPWWDEWKLGIFSHAVTYEDYNTKYFILGGTSWVYCIPYEGNEHLFSGENTHFKK